MNGCVNVAVVDVPLSRINPVTLRKMIEEFVTRELSDLSDTDCTFEIIRRPIDRLSSLLSMILLLIIWMMHIKYFVIKYVTDVCCMDF